MIRIYMNRFQKIKFHSIDDFLDYIPEQELKIVACFRKLIFTCIPDCEEKLAYNVPFYYRHQRVCFIWPASIPWGNVKMNGVQLGFCQGYLLRDEIDYLEKGNRKQVYSKTVTAINEIEVDILKAYLFEAIRIDDQLHQKKRIKNNNP